MPETKEETLKQLEQKKEEKPFLAGIPPIFLIVGGILIFLALRSITIDSEKGTNYLFLVIIVVVILYLLSRQNVKETLLVTPKEAELLAERECERKLRWGQWPLMSEYKIGPVSDLAHKDSRGLHYEVGVTVTNPSWGRPIYYIARVQAQGPERAFTTLIESISPMTGRDIQQIKDITKPPEWLKRTGRYPILEKLWMGGR